jgi:hypothetical protein
MMFQLGSTIRPLLLKPQENPFLRDCSLRQMTQLRYNSLVCLVRMSLDHANDPPLVAVLTKTSHCSKFNKYFEYSVQLESDSLTSMELLVDGIKSALDMALCSHFSFTPYNEWGLDYLITTNLCPPELHVHPRYTMMCINFNAFGLVLHRFLWGGTPITFGRIPTVYHELTALHHITC